MKNLYLVEFYLKNSFTGETGWEIKFAWVGADTLAQARAKVAAVKNFDCVISADQQAEPFPLSGVVDPMWIDCDEARDSVKGVWSRIECKAKSYKTARRKVAGDFVQILSVPVKGTFTVRTIAGEVLDYGCHELVDYCL